MSNWADYLTPIDQVSHGCAIISSQGVLLGKMGKWYPQDEEQYIFSFLMNDPVRTQSMGLYYGGEKYKVTKATGETVIGQDNKRGVVLQKANAVVVAAYYTSGNVDDVCNRVSYVANKLTSR